MNRPLPPEVYRRRRVVVGAGSLGIIVIIWVLVMAVLGGGDDDAAPQGTGAQSASPSPTVEETPEDVDGTVPASLNAGETACDPTSVRITPSVPAEQAAGGPVSLVLTVSSTQAKPCLLEASAAQLVVVIDNGEDPVYDSTTCNTSLLTTPISLSPEWATVTTVTWNGRVSGATCADAEAAVPGGTYTVKLGTLGGEPGDASFTLAEAPAAPADPATEPDPATESDPAPEPTEPAVPPTAPAH